MAAVVGCWPYWAVVEVVTSIGPRLWGRDMECHVGGGGGSGGGWFI